MRKTLSSDELGYTLVSDSSAAAMTAFGVGYRAAPATVEKYRQVRTEQQWPDLIGGRRQPGGMGNCRRQCEHHEKQIAHCLGSPFDNASRPEKGPADFEETIAATAAAVVALDDDAGARAGSVGELTSSEASPVRPARQMSMPVPTPFRDCA